jgi:threonine/homoserine/homoserine lactone efflux protein
MSLASVLKRWLDKAANRRVLNRAMAVVFVILALVIALR